MMCSAGESMFGRVYTLGFWFFAPVASNGKPAAASCSASKALRRSPLALSAMLPIVPAGKLKPVSTLTCCKALSMFAFVSGLKLICAAPAASNAARSSCSPYWCLWQLKHMQSGLRSHAMLASKGQQQLLATKLNIPCGDL